MVCSVDGVVVGVDFGLSHSSRAPFATTERGGRGVESRDDFLPAPEDLSLKSHSVLGNELIFWLSVSFSQSLQTRQKDNKTIRRRGEEDVEVEGRVL